MQIFPVLNREANIFLLRDLSRDLLKTPRKPPPCNLAVQLM